MQYSPLSEAWKSYLHFALTNNKLWKRLKIFLITGKLEFWKLVTSDQVNKLAILHTKSSSTHKSSCHHRRPDIMKTSRQLALQDQKASYVSLYFEEDRKTFKVPASKIIGDSIIGSNMIVWWSDEENVNALVIGLANKLDDSNKIEFEWQQKNPKNERIFSSVDWRFRTRLWSSQAIFIGRMIWQSS